METSQELDVVTWRCAWLSWRLAAQLEADRMRAVRMGFACLVSFAVAYSARSAQITQVRVMALRSGEARESRSEHDLQVAHNRLSENRHVDACAI